jgi:isoleucyl-tRNA synthetase
MPLVNQILQGGDGTPFVRSIQEKGYFTITVDGNEEILRLEDILVEVSQRADFFTASDNGVSVALDARLTPELVEEGFVREVISKVQQLRREAGFEVTDHITLMVDGAPAALETVLRNGAAISTDVFADELTAGRGEGFGKEQDINGETMWFTVRKI